MACVRVISWVRPSLNPHDAFVVPAVPVISRSSQRGNSEPLVVAPSTGATNSTATFPGAGRMCRGSVNVASAGCFTSTAVRVFPYWPDESTGSVTFH